MNFCFSSSDEEDQGVLNNVNVDSTELMIVDDADNNSLTSEFLNNSDSDDEYKSAKKKKEKDKMNINSNEEKKRGRPPVKTDRRNLRRRERSEEIRLIKQLSQQDITKKENHQALIAAAALAAGKQKLPMFRPPVTTEQVQQLQILHANSKILAETKGKVNSKSEMRAILARNLDNKTTMNLLNCSESTSRRMRQSNQPESNRISPNVSNEFSKFLDSTGVRESEPRIQLIPKTINDVEQKDHVITAVPYVVKCSKRGRGKICPTEKSIYKQYFESKTDVRSGSSNQLRQMHYSKHVLMCDLFASFPSQLRSFCKSSEGVDFLSAAKEKLKKTRFEIAVVESSKPLQNISEAEEHTIRLRYAKEKYMKHLEEKRSQKVKSKKIISDTGTTTLVTTSYDNCFRTLINELQEAKQTVQTNIKRIQNETKTTNEAELPEGIKEELLASKKQLHRINNQLQEVPIFLSVDHYQQFFCVLSNL